MKQRYDQVSNQHIESLERKSNYKHHITRVSSLHGGIDSTQPCLSPRHQLIARKAERRHREYLNKVRIGTFKKVHNSNKKYISILSKEGEQIPPRKSVDPYSLALFSSTRPENVRSGKEQRRLERYSDFISVSEQRSTLLKNEKKKKLSRAKEQDESDTSDSLSYSSFGSDD